MNYRPLLLAVATSLLATSALAAPVFMLQFGSFETKDEASTHLDSMKTKYVSALGSLNATIREVTLPPDNLTVYRTQAGPVSSRAEAQSVCAKLSADGGNCYVVETAMVDKAGAPAVAAITPAAPAIEKPAAMSSMSVPSLTASPIVTPESSAPRMTELPARDAQSVAMIDGLLKPDSNKAFKDMPLQDAPSIPRTPLQDDRPIETALNDAAARQASGMPMSNAAVPAAAPAPKKETSFWSRMNPFSDDEVAKAPKKPKLAPVSDTALAAPIDRVVSAEPFAPVPNPAMMDATAPTLPPLESTEAPAVAPALAPIVAVAEPIPPMTPLPSPTLIAQAAPAAAPVPAAPLPPLPGTQPLRVVDVPAAPMVVGGSSLLLPPPPAPLRAQDREALAAGRIPASAPQISPVMIPQSTGELPRIASAPSAAPAPVYVAPSVPSTPFKQGPSTLPGGGEAQGNVRVGEAQRVPLTQTTVPPQAPQSISPFPVAAVASAVPPQLQPSATVGQKTLWAQIGQFSDAQAALSFWDSYRRSHPDFPVVRVRVTSPYQEQLRGMSAVSLRVGPFARAESVGNLCSTMSAERLQCVGVTDLGMAADPKGDQSGMLPGSRYQH